MLQWQRMYARRLVAADVVALVWGVGGATFVLFDPFASELVIPIGDLRVVFGYVPLAILMVITWLGALMAFGSRRSRVIGTGSAEIKAVMQASLTVLVLFGLGAFALRVDVSRWFMLVAIVSGIIALLVGRLLWRWWLRTRRAGGEFCQRVLIVGSVATATLLAGDLKRTSAAGYRIVGACIDDATGPTLPGSDVPVLGGVHTVEAALRASGADTVLIAGGHRMSPQEVRTLSWSLEPGRHHLIVAPSLTDVAGPRIHARPVAGLPLVHVETPRYEGPDRYLKRAFDVVVSLAVVILLAPLLLTVAVLIKLSSPGPVFFSHERIGKGGAAFPMFKFRSMVPNADAMLADLLREQGTSETPLFKVENDPRITPVGRFIRKYSIDELPQILNVLRGDMSLVGPRPQVQREVQLYDNAAARRLFVKPGMTGLWQVSGRSNLTWEESVRFDLYYVENWSMAADMHILWRTFRAVVASDGAV